MKTLVRTFGFLVLALAPVSAFAHHAEWMRDRPFVQGLSMPVHGLDHMLVAISIGLLATQLGGRSRWAVPGVFSLLMLAGGLMNVSGIAVPFVEQGILASVVVVGAMLALRPQISLLLGLAVIGACAAFHGSALIGEAPRNWSFTLFAVGCLLSAFVLQAFGMALGLLMQKTARGAALYRYAGTAMLVAAGVIYFFPPVNDVVIRFLE